jgi:hypothetical protein
VQVEAIIALIITVAVLLFPAAFVWYINIGGIYLAIKQRLKKEERDTEKHR